MKKIVTILLCFLILILTACHAENFIHDSIAEAASYSVSGNKLLSNEETEIVLKSEKADFTGNGIDFDVIVVEYMDGYFVRVLDKSTVIFERNLSIYHPEWDSFSLCRVNGKTCILEYNPYMSMGMGAYKYLLYGYSEFERAFCVIDESCVQYDLNKQQIPYEQLAQFKETVDSYIDNSTLIISSLNGNPQTGGKLEPVDLSLIRDRYTFNE